MIRLSKDLSKKLLVKPGKGTLNLKLKDFDPTYHAGKIKEDIENDMPSIFKQMSYLQYKLFADSSKSLLIILQGVDASGKDGTIKHVMTALNPQNCYVKSFKVPNEEELAHDYLWRIHNAIPPKGQISIFNRSHYEDVIETSVHNVIPNDELAMRYRQINEFERYLSENHVTILKFFLYISKEEQKKKLEARLEDPTKHWKIKESDFIDHQYWDEYIEAYEKVLNLCNTEWAPWYVIPANSKHFRNWAIAKIITKTLENMKLEFPEINVQDLSKLIVD